MKKNIAMRLASGLMLSCLLSTCVISGTFAKYTTSDDAKDSARVAKWGVTVTTEGALFSETYAMDATTGTDDLTDAISVKVVTAGTNVVAPGTKNEDGMTFTLTGTPEVDVNVTVEIAIDDIMLAAGTYADPTDGEGNFEITGDGYYPVEFTLTNGAGATLVDAGTLAEVKDELEKLGGNYDTNTNLAELNSNTDGTYKLTWAWAFNGNDAADTYLANQLPLDEISFEIKITVTQID